MTRTHVRLLGPCFKTGRRGHRPTRDRDAARDSKITRYTRPLHYLPAAQPRQRGSDTRKELHPRLRYAASSSSREVLEKCSHQTNRPPRSVLADRKRSSCRNGSLSLQHRLRETPPFTTTQFHVLLNSLFKVLFNFPSRYLFAIGLGVIFSLMWSLPHTLSCTPKQLDSRRNSVQRPNALRAYHPLRAVAPVKEDLDVAALCKKRPSNTTCHTTERVGGSVMGSARFIRHY